MKRDGIVFLIFLALSIISCNDDDGSISRSERDQALLGQWEYKAIITDRAVDINGDGEFNIDLFNTQEIRQCLKDNLIFFSERGVGEKGAYSVNENGLACEDGLEFSTIEEDSYELVNENSVIQFDTRNEMRILQLTKEKLVIDTNDNLGGTEVVVTITFKKS